jgi:dynein heavy chain
MGIIQDLFPGVDIPKNEYPDLEEAICNQLTLHSLQIVPNFLNKIFELYETMNVRHGVMLVGSTGTGKTKCYETLSRAFQ